MNVGAIGDTQLPAEHPGYLSFCEDTFEAWDCTRFIHMGDFADCHNQAFHDHHPECGGPRAEYDETVRKAEDWYSVFPNLTLLDSNHDWRPARVAAKFGFVPEMLTPLPILWKVPEWKWVENVVIDGCLFVHGDGCGGGEHPAWNYLKKINDYSVAMAHFHTKCGLKWRTGNLSRRFGWDVGCGVDRLHPGMRYDRKNPIKPILACGVLIDGIPYIEIMPCASGERYHRSNF